MKDILRSYKLGWSCFLVNWRIVLLIFIVNLIIAFISVGPLSVAIGAAFGSNGQLGNFIGSFDYSLVTDFLRIYSLQVSSFTSRFLPLALVYLLLYCFYYGGLTQIAIGGKKRLDLPGFFNACSRYFWKMVLLAMIVIFMFVLIFFLLFRFFSIEGFNPFELETELGLINRFWIAMALLAIASFFITTFRDFTKINIVVGNPDHILGAIKKGIKHGLKSGFLMLSLLNVIVLMAILLLFQVLKSGIGEFSIVTIILGQLLIIFRIAYKLIRLASFSAIQR